MAPTSYRSALSRVLDEIMSDAALTSHITEAVRDGVPEISVLGEEDITEQVRLFVQSGLDAAARRRPPTSRELDHVSRFAGTRARQQIPIVALLSSLHIGQHITLEAIAERLSATAPEVPPGAVVEAFTAYLRWAQAVESRLIAAHREAEIATAREAHDQEVELLRALVEGPVLTRHVAELTARGFVAGAELWVLRTQADGRLVRSVVSLGGATLQARLADEHVMVTDNYQARRRRPATAAATNTAPAGAAPTIGTATATAVGATAPALATPALATPALATAALATAAEAAYAADSAVTVAVAGPVRPDRIPAAYQLAGRVLAAAERTGRTGLHSAATVAMDMVRLEHPEIGRALAREHFGGLHPDDEWARVLVETFVVHMDSGQRLDATAAALFVHPNTIRHRLRRLEELAGVVPESRMRERINIWWAARAWLDMSRAWSPGRTRG